MFKDRLERIEAQLQSLVEGNVARLFPASHLPRELATSLVGALKRGSQTTPDGQILAPNLYTIHIHPDQAQILSDNPSLVDGLTRLLYEAGEESGYFFPSYPIIRVVQSPDTFEVNARNSLADLVDTSDLVIHPGEQKTADIPENAFLIVNGTQIFALDKAVVNIGRRPDNHIVIEDARVSRLHAQLRAIQGRYVIFDLNSMGGTQINGKAIQKGTLYPGDVISLAGVPLVYGQEAMDPGETQTMLPPPRDLQSK